MMKKQIAVFAMALVSLPKSSMSYTTSSTSSRALSSLNTPTHKSKGASKKATELSRHYEPPDSSSESSMSPKSIPGWHRRVLKKVFRRGRKSDRLNMQAAAVAEDGKTSDRTAHIEDGYSRQGFVLKTPEELFPLNPDLISPLVEVSEEESQVVIDDVNAIVENGHVGRGSPYARITRSWFQNILSQRLDRWSIEKSNINIQCEPRGNIVQFVRGRFHCDAIIDFERVVFGNIRMSGGQLEVKKFGLNLYKGLAPASVPQYPNQFDFVAKNVTFTQEDLLQSSCIRNNLRRLASRILKKRGIVAFATKINSIKILPSGKVSCSGEAATLVGPPILFEVRSGIDFTSRGHILTFPGLEIAIGPSLGLFVPIRPEVSVDIGHNAQLLDLNIDTNAASLTLSARVTITPEHTIVIKRYQQSSAAYGALCSVDVGRWLTRLGRFAH